MYLKRIEAVGFKSFATKTIINFDKGLTAIVGPNGSGKSNVSDSIRFVLGEQSVKSLRGGKMEDVIFAGTDDKKALNMAEVTIVLDNEGRELPLDFSEVSITRRIYRAGGGEYLINGEKARLKDVTDLIMDSGIGHDSLSMISQDQVKQVIEGKPEDRRLILEESAGILKYKTRKKEAVRKLGYTNENLQRVSDIIGELENSLGPLSIQAKEAKEYLEIKEKLSDLEIRLLAHDIKVDNENLGNLKKENEDLTIKMLELAKQTESDEQRQMALNDDHSQLSHHVDDLQFELTNLTEEAQKKRGESNVVKERIANAGVNKAQLEGRITTLEVNLSNLSNQITTAEDKAKSAATILEAKKQDDKEAYRIKHILPLEEKLQTKQAEYQKHLSATLEDNKKLAEIASQSQHAEYQLGTAKNQLGFLLDAQEDFAGFSEGTKQILRAKKQGKLTGIEGAVAEVVTVPSELENAMDVILGPITSQIITENDTSAKQAITYLKNNRYGRATFLPMNIMKSRRLAPDLLMKAKQISGFVTLASDALTFDKKYLQIIENLIGNVVIANNLDAANNIARATNHRFRIVTLDGDVINPGGAMTGGAMNRKNTSSVLKQKGQITKQQELIAKLEESIINFEASQLNLKQELAVKEETANIHEQEVLAIEEALAAAREDSMRSSYELKVEVATMEANLQNQIAEVKRLNEEYLALDEEITEAKTTLNSSGNIVEQLSADLLKLEQDIEDFEAKKQAILEDIRKGRENAARLVEEIKRLEIETREARRVSNDVNMSLNKLSGEIGKLDMKIDVAIEKLEHDYEMTYDYAHLHYPLRADVAGAREEVGALNRQLSRYKAVNIGAIDEYQRQKERHDFLAAESADLIAAAENLQASINEMDSEMVSKFKVTFDQVRVHYIETFKELFGGGEADLLLTDPGDLLNTGVEIIARPPGTKLGTSNLLSGGQKALTSIAMLFAILKIRTIPFCILDEVEAALDEANVARYAKYLKHFSDQTQFIVITHRRGTMEEADILYGVTMQERGVTTMVSVKMDAIDAYVDSA